MKFDIQNIKNCLAELADVNFQRRVWLAKSGPEVSSFSELKSQLFDDTGLSDIMDSPLLENYFGKITAFKLRKLDRLVSRIDEFIEPDVLIELPEMQEVRVLAKEIIKTI